MPSPEPQRGLRQTAQIKGAREVHIAVIRPIAVPKMIAAVGFRVEQAGARVAVKVQGQIVAPFQIDIVHAKGGDFRDSFNRKAPMLNVKLRLGPVNEVVAKAAVAQLRIIQIGCDNPIREHVFEIQARVLVSQDGVDASGAVGRMSDHGFRQLLAKTVQQIGGKEVGAAVMGRAGIVVRPGVKLGVRPDRPGIVMASGVKAVDQRS